MRVAGTRIFIANAFWLMPSGKRNSSRRISPGCVVGFSNFHPDFGLFMAILLSVIVNNLNIVRPVVFPDETDTELIVDANVVLPGPVSFKSLQPVSRRSL